MLWLPRTPGSAKPVSPALKLTNSPLTRDLLLFLPLIGTGRHPSEAYGPWARYLRGADPWTDVATGGDTLQWRGHRSRVTRRIQDGINEGYSSPTLPLGTDVGSGDFSIIWSAYMKTLTNTGIRGAFGFGSFDPGFYWRSGSGNVAVYDGGWKETGTSFPSDNAWITVGMSRRNGVLQVHWNGRPVGTTVTWSDTLANGAFNFGIQASGNSTPTDVSYEYVALSRRAYTTAEHNAWHTDPYEIVESDADRIHAAFVPVAAAGGVSVPIASYHYRHHIGA